MSEDSPGIQLATRHCFLLEDPPNEKKDPLALESAATDTSNGDAAKEENQEQISNANDEPKYCTEKNKENAVPIKNEKSLSAENDTYPSVEIEKMGMENDKNLSIENEKTGAENDKCLSVEKEKTNVENDKNQSKETEKDMSTEKENNTSVENGKGACPENEKNSSVPSQDCLEKPSATKESTEAILPSEAAASGAKDLDNPAFPGEQMGPSAVKDGSNSTNPKDSGSPMLPGELTCPSAVKDGSNSTNPKDSGSPMLPGELTCPSAVKDGSDSVSPMVISYTDPKDSREPGLPVEVVTSSGNEVNELKTTDEKPDSMNDSGNLASVDVVEQILNTSMVEDNKPPSEEQESKQKAGTDSTIECTETQDGADIKVPPINNGKDNSLSTNDDQSNHSINKLKRAAITVLSATAVKAKLLANQEEDQIGRLVSLITEKQKMGILRALMVSQQVMKQL